jgi:hypothetical protein
MMPQWVPLLIYVPKLVVLLVMLGEDFLEWVQEQSFHFRSNEAK